MAVGVAIIMAFATAFVGPYFVDWTQWRPAIEAEATRILGLRVRVLGAADVRLLPVPSISLDDVRVGAADAPVLTAGRVSAEIDLPSLLRGAVHVTGLDLDRPVIRLAFDDGGALVLAPGARATGALGSTEVALEGVGLRDGAVEISDARSGLSYRLDHLAATLDARSLAGPYRMTGSLQAGDEPVSFSLATAVREGDTVKLKTDLSSPRWPMQIAADGAVELSGPLPVYSGRFAATPPPPPAGAAKAATAAPPAPLLNRVSGAFRLESAGLALSGLEAGFGAGGNVAAFDGTANYAFAPAPRFDVDLAAKQLDLDLLAGSSSGHVVSPSAALEMLAATLPALPLPAVPGRLRLEAGSMVMAGGMVLNGRLDASPGAEGWQIAALSAEPPGRSRLSFSGTMQSGREPRLEGRMRLASEQPGTFGAWLRGTARVPTGLQPVSLEAGFAFDRSGLTVGDYVARLGNDPVEGALSWHPAAAGAKEAVSLSARARRLDFDRVAELGRAIAPGGLAGLAEAMDGDIAIAVAADRAVVGGIDGRAVDVEATFAGGNLDVRRLDIEDLAGARISATGTVEAIGTRPRGSLTASIAASRFEGLVALAQAMAPEAPGLAAFARAAPLLGPASLDARFEAGPVGPASSMKLTLGGDVGGSALDVRGSFTGTFDDWREGLIGLSIEAQGPDGIRLIGQLGLPVVPVRGSGPAGLALSLTGRAAGELQTVVAADFAGSRLDVSGHLTAPATSDAEGSFDVKLRSTDLAPAAVAFGQIAPGLLGSVPARLDAHLEMKGRTVAVSRLEGNVADSDIVGDGTLSLAAARPAVHGALSVSDLSGPFAAELGLGTGSWSLLPADGGVWPDSAFGPSLLSGADFDVALKASGVGLGVLTLTGATATLKTAPGVISFDGIAGALAGGKLSGSLSFNSGERGAVTARGTLALQDADIAVLAGSAPGGLSGIVSASLSGEATGRSVAGLMATLSANGTLEARDIALPQLDPGAFAAVRAAADQGSLPLEEGPVAGALQAGFAGSPLQIAGIAGTLTVTNGILRLTDGNFRLAVPDAALRGAATLDLIHAQTDTSLTLSVPAGDADPDRVADAVPSVGVRYSGPLAAPARSIDAAAYTAYLNLRAIGRETKRVDALQQQVLEAERLRRERRQLEADAAQRKAEADARAAAARAAAEQAAAEKAAAEKAAAEAAARSKATTGGTGAFHDEIDRVLRQSAPPKPAAPTNANQPTAPLQ